jgi:hypothetical protein
VPLWTHPVFRWKSVRWFLDFDRLFVIHKRMNTRQQIRKQDAVLPAIRMYSEELKTIQKAARIAKQTLSEYVRRKLLGESQAENPAK